MEVDNGAWYRRRESVVVRLAEKVRLRPGLQPGLQLRLGFGEIGHGMLLLFGPVRWRWR
jgi:hypothetical protein